LLEIPQSEAVSTRICSMGVLFSQRGNNPSGAYPETAIPIAPEPTPNLRLRPMRREGKQLP